VKVAARAASCNTVRVTSWHVHFYGEYTWQIKRRRELHVLGFTSGCQPTRKRPNIHFSGGLWAIIANSPLFFPAGLWAIIANSPLFFPAGLWAITDHSPTKKWIFGLLLVDWQPKVNRKTCNFLLVSPHFFSRVFSVDVHVSRRHTHSVTWCTRQNAIYIVTHFHTVFSLLFTAHSSSGTITYLIPPKRRSFFAWLRTEKKRILKK